MDIGQKRFLSSLAALLAKMAKADGVVTLDERDKVSSIWVKLGLTIEQSQYCSQAFNIAQNDGVNLHRYVQEFVATQFGIDAREFLYGLMWDVACADGILHKKEKTILQELPNALGLPPDSYDIYYGRHIRNGRLAVDAEVEEQKNAARQKAEDSRRRAHEEARRRAEEYARRRAEEESRRKRERTDKGFSSVSGIDSAYALLGCSAHASNAELKTAYRKAAMRWHPDRLRAEGVPQELIDKATERMKTLNSAWDIIKKRRKIS